MGVDRTDYLMLGVDVGSDAVDWDHHEAEIEGRTDARFDLIDDGMCGEYAIAGKIIAVSDEYNGFENAVIEPEKLDVDRDALASKISDAFGKPVAAADMKLILFSHFS